MGNIWILSLLHSVRYFMNTCEGIELFLGLSFLAFCSKWRQAEGVTPLPLYFWDITTIPGEH
jgi:hypothetical protein